MNDLNITAKTVKLLEETIGENLHDIGFGNGFLEMTRKATKEYRDKLDLIQIKSFYASKDIKKVKRKPRELKKIIYQLQF